MERKAAEEALAMRHENASRIRLDRLRHEVMRCSELVNRAKRVSKQHKEQVTASKAAVQRQERYPVSCLCGIQCLLLPRDFVEGT